MKNNETKSREKFPRIVLMVNDKDSCNISCAHCYLPYKGVRSPKSTLDLVNNLKSKFNITIAGSELLTNSEYLNSLQLAGQKYILTNGLILHKNPEIFADLKNHGIEEIRISLHFGIQKDLNSVPQKIVAEVIEKAVEKGFKTQITTTITPQNYKKIAEICDKAYLMGAQKIQFINYIKSGSANNESREVLNDKEKQLFFDEVDKSREKFDKNKLEIIIHGNFGPKKGSRGEILSKQNNYCPAGKDFFVIDPNNKIYRCPLLMNSAIGEINKNYQLKIAKFLENSDRSQCLANII